MFTISRNQLEKLDFEFKFEFKEPDCFYQEFEYKNLLVTLEKGNNKLEIVSGQTFIPVEGVSDCQQLEKFIELLHGKP